MTGQDLINGALRLIGAISSSETPSSNETTDAQFALNDIIESWANEGLMINLRTIETFPLVANQQTYTMGPTGNFNTTRPTRIEQVGLQYNTIELPIEIKNEEEWSSILIKSTTSNIPQRLYMDNAFPLLGLNFWPVPSEANNVVIYSIKPLASITDLTATLAMPPGYARCLRYCLAGELLPEYGKPIDPTIAGIATESKADIKRQNTQPVYMKGDATGLTTRKPFNWLTGE